MAYNMRPRAHKTQRLIRQMRSFIKNVISWQNIIYKIIELKREEFILFWKIAQNNRSSYSAHPRANLQSVTKAKISNQIKCDNIPKYQTHRTPFCELTWNRSPSDPHLYNVAHLDFATARLLSHTRC